MHISYPSEITGERYEPKISLSERIWQLIRFSVITGMIFVVSFFVINFQAYQQILGSILQPEVQAAAEEALEVATGAKQTMDPSQLLPELPTKKEVSKHFAWVDMPVAPTDNRIIIPKIGKSIPLVHMTTENLEGENWPELEAQIQDSLRGGVVHYPGTAKPGQYGNVFITGHSSYYPWDPGQFKDVFALLGQLEVGDRFYIYFDQIKYTYEINEKFEVQPSNVDVLQQPKNKKIATLMTCTPVGTTLRRLIIRAEQIT